MKEKDYVVAGMWMPNAGEKKQIAQIKPNTENPQFNILIFEDGTSGFAKNYKKLEDDGILL